MMKRAAPVLALNLLLAGPALAQIAVPPSSVGAVSTLIHQAERWLANNRPDLAATSIARALAAEPANAEALLLSARIETARGNRDAAVGLLRRAQATAAPDQQVTVAAALQGATLDPAALEAARRLARDGHPDEAATRYRALFGPNGPPPDYAREYYQTLAGSAATRAEGLAGLARIAAQPGADPATLIAQAEALTYQDGTRADGISRLRALADRPETQAGAQRAWRQALGFMAQDPRSVPEIEAYLKRFPNDPELTQRVAALRQTAPAPASAPPNPADAIRRDAFALLDTGALPAASDKFQAALAINPADADALGGLGIVRLRQNRPDEARPLLDRAIAADPAHAAQWQKALDGASYGVELAQSRALLARGDIAGADAILRQALRRDVADRSDAETLLGDVSLRQGDRAAAELHYRAALSRRPGFPPAVNGLAQAQRGPTAPAPPPRGEERASPSVSPSGSPSGSPSVSPSGRPPPAPLPALPPPPQLAVTEAPSDAVGQLRAQAAQVRDSAVATHLLRAALEQAPADPWVRLDLARALKRQGRGPEGQALVEELAARDNTPDSHFAAALLAQEDGRLDAADAQLGAIPAQRRTPDMARLQAQLRTGRDVAQAAAAARAEGPAGGPAKQHLIEIAARPDPSGLTAAAVIRALGESADRAGAVEASRVALAANAGAAARLAVAGALLESGADAQSGILADQLDQANLTADQRRDLAALRAGLAIRAADRLNDAGTQAEAFEKLRPVLAQDPDNPDGQLALARLYQGARQPAEALRLAQSVLARDPRNFAARQGAVEAALALGDRDTARALAVDPQAGDSTDSRMLYLRAKVARAGGDIETGQALLEQSLARRRAELGVGAPADLSAPPASANPFQPRTPLTQARGAAQSSDPLIRQIAQDLASLAKTNTPALAFVPSIHTRSGTAGLDQLAQVSAPIETTIPAPGLGGTITATVEPVMITAGQLGGSNQSLYRFGSNPLLGTAPIVPKNATGNGVALSVGYELGDRLKISAGTTPIGFHVANVIGGFEFNTLLTDSLRLRVNGSRHAVTDSLLSWAGVTDPISHTTWGSVVSTGGRAQLEMPIGAGSAYVGGGYALITGQNVASNNRTEIGAGFSYPLLKKPEGELTAGLDLVYFGFANNQRAFTLGHGGYFSPQSYAAVNIPVDYRARLGRFSYRVGALLGYASFHESSNLVFPRNPDLQSRLETAALTNSVLITRNPALTRTGLVAGVRLDVGYQLTDWLTLSAALRYDQAPQFDETNVMLRLTGTF